MNNVLEKIRSGEVEYLEADEGVVNTTYIADDYVVQEPADGSEDQVRLSKFLGDILYQDGAPVPEVLEFGEDPVYIVFEKIDGVSLGKRDEFSDQEYLEAVRNAGATLGRIHQQEGFGYGEPDVDQGFRAGSHDSWRGFVEDYIQGSLDYVTSDRFRPVVEKAAELVNMDAIPANPDSRVLHMDYTQDNIMVGPDLKTTAIDFDDAHYGDPRLDLVYAKMVMSKDGDEATEAFNAGYEEVRDPELTEELERSYLALAVMRDARGGEWCLKNDKDVNFDEWSQGLGNIIDNA